MGTPYDEDVLRWAEEQAALLREGKLELIDVQHVAEEIPMPGLGHSNKSARKIFFRAVREQRYCSLRNGSAGSGLQRT